MIGLIPGAARRGGTLPLHHVGQPQPCNQCGVSNWWVGRNSSTCANCGCVVEIAVGIRGGGVISGTGTVTAVGVRALPR